MAKLAVIGAGQVGLVAGACLAELGHMVTCVEIVPEKLAMLQRGELPIYEPGLNELVVRHVAQRRLSFTSDYQAAISPSVAAFIAVNTPSSESGQADVSAVFQALASIVPWAQPGFIVVMKSTVPPGTGDAVADFLGTLGAKDVEVVSNPEFLRQGSAVKDFLEPDRIVIGAAAPWAAQTIGGLYAGVDAPVIMCSRRSAELGKYAANAFLATRISFMNQIANVCDAVQADIAEVAQIMGSDPRIGPAYLKAGLGWGGSCFPKDVQALAETGALHGYRPSLLDVAYQVNVEQRRQAFDRLMRDAELARGGTAGVLGLSFKPDTDDLREAPALDIIRWLLDAGVTVRVHDPVAAAKAMRLVPEAVYCADPYEVAAGSDAILLATEWPQYQRLDWGRVRSLMRGRLIVDGRNVLDQALLTGLGFAYSGFGRPAMTMTAEDLAGLTETAVTHAKQDVFAQ